MRDIEQLQVDVNDANKRISESLDRMIANCEVCMEIIRRIDSKMDQL